MQFTTSLNEALLVPMRCVFCVTELGKMVFSSCFNPHDCGRLDTRGTRVHSQNGGKKDPKSKNLISAKRSDETGVVNEEKDPRSCIINSEI